VLERCSQTQSDNQWLMACDLPGHESDKKLLLAVLQFTANLVEQSFTRHLYNSMDHLTALLSSSDMAVVLAVLDVLYMFRYVPFSRSDMAVVLAVLGVLYMFRYVLPYSSVYVVHTYCHS